MTLLRLWIRKKHGHLGYDDLAITVSLVATISLMVSTNLYVDDPSASLSPFLSRSELTHW